jgi:hypothetical protein
MAHQPPPFSARPNQRPLPDIPDSTPPGTTLHLNSGPRKLGTKAFYVSNNGQEYEKGIKPRELESGA